MGNNKKNGQPQYAPSHLGTKPVKYKANKGEKCMILPDSSRSSCRQKASSAESSLILGGTSE